MDPTTSTTISLTATTDRLTAAPETAIHGPTDWRTTDLDNHMVPNEILHETLVRRDTKTSGPRLDNKQDVRMPRNPSEFLLAPNRQNFFENPAEKGTPEWIAAEVENMTQYFKQLDSLQPRKDQTSAELLKARLSLISKFLEEFHKKFVTTHQEELGDMAEVEAATLHEEHLKYFSNLYTEKMTNTIQDEEDNANIDKDAFMEEDSEVSDEGDDEDD